MATISAGLAATIREWFSEGENVTTVETAEKVHLDEVRVRKKPRHMEGTAESDGEETEVSVLEPEEILTEAVTVEEPEPVVMEEPQQEVLESTPAEVVQVGAGADCSDGPAGPGGGGPGAGSDRSQGRREASGTPETRGEAEGTHDRASRRPDARQAQACQAQRPAGGSRRGPRAHGPTAVQVQASLRCPGYRAPDLQEQRSGHGRQAGRIRGRRQEGREGPHHQGSDPRPSQGRGG